MFKGNAKVYALLVFVQAVFYGIDNIAMKVAYVDLTPMWCQAIRFGLAFVLFIIFFGRGILGNLRAASPRVWLPVGVAYACAFVASSLSVALTTATNAGFFISIPMLFAPLFAYVLMRRRYRPAMVVLQVAVLAGLYMLCCNGGGLSFGAGEAVGTLASALFALGVVLSERGVSEVSPASMAAVQTGGAFVLSLAGAAFSEPLPSLAAVGLPAWAAVAFLAIAGTCAAFWLQNVTLKHLSASTVSVILCFEPVVTAVASFFVLSETLSLIGIVGAFVIVSCTIAATLIDESH